jgi:hypothetical protein
MSFRLFMRAILVAALLAPVGVAIAAVPARASGPMITVTPNTGLAEGQTVTIAATGFTLPLPNTVDFGECALGAVNFLQCDLSTISTVGINTESFSTTYAVTRHIVTALNIDLDCAAANTCEILGGNNGQLAAAPITLAAPHADIAVLNARSMRRVHPGDPVEVRVRAANEGPATTSWGVTQTPGAGLAATAETCGRGGVVGPNGGCSYASTSPKVGHAVKTTFILMALPGFAGTATDQVCVHDENSNDVDPNPANNCATVSVLVR